MAFTSIGTIAALRDAEFMRAIDHRSSPPAMQYNPTPDRRTSFLETRTNTNLREREDDDLTFYVATLFLQSGAICELNTLNIMGCRVLPLPLS